MYFFFMREKGMDDYCSKSGKKMKFVRVISPVISALLLVSTLIFFYIAYRQNTAGAYKACGIWSVACVAIVFAVTLIASIAGRGYSKSIYNMLTENRDISDRSFSIIGALNNNYNAVYYCNLVTGEVKFLQLGKRIMNYMSREYSESHPLEWYAKAYAEKLIAPENIPAFLAVVNCENLKEKLKDRDYYTYVYLADKNGKQNYFKMKAAKVEDDPNRLVIGFADIGSEV